MIALTLQQIKLPESGTFLYESKHNEKDVVNEHHHPIHQILYAIEGTGVITVNGRSQHVTSDVITILAPYSTHSIVSNSKLTLLILAFHSTAFDSFIQNEIIN